MKNLGLLITFAGLFFFGSLGSVSANESVPTQFTLYQKGERILVYGKTQIIWDCWSNKDPSFLYVKDGSWRQAAKAKVKKSSSCDKEFPYRHTYRWTIDVLGAQGVDGKRMLEIAIGYRGNRYPAVVQEFANVSEQANSYLCGYLESVGGKC